MRIPESDNSVRPWSIAASNVKIRINILYLEKHGWGLNIRKFQPSDLDALSTIERKSFGAAAYSKRMLRRMFEDKEGMNFIAEDRGKILGYICALPLTVDAADIESIAVEPASQNSGVGSILFDELEQVLTRTGYMEIVLEVRENNTPAINFYKKRGFKITEYLPSYYKTPVDGTRNAYRMRKYLDL